MNNENLPIAPWSIVTHVAQVKKPRHSTKSENSTPEAIKGRLFWWSTPNANGCWDWRGHLNNAGYGMVGIKKDWKWGMATAHRLSYSVFKGPITEGMFVCHSCDRKICINPAHLWLGTRIDNIKDMVVKKRNASGDQHWTRRHPEWLARGVRHGSKTHPEQFLNRTRNS